MSRVGGSCDAEERDYWRNPGVVRENRSRTAGGTTDNAKSGSKRIRGYNPAPENLITSGAVSGAAVVAGVNIGNSGTKRVRRVDVSMAPSSDAADDDVEVVGKRGGCSDGLGRAWGEVKEECRVIEKTGREQNEDQSPRSNFNFGGGGETVPIAVRRNKHAPQTNNGVQTSRSQQRRQEQATRVRNPEEQYDRYQRQQQQPQQQLPQQWWEPIPVRSSNVPPEVQPGSSPRVSAAMSQRTTSIGSITCVDRTGILALKSLRGATGAHRGVEASRRVETPTSLDLGTASPVRNGNLYSFPRSRVFDNRRGDGVEGSQRAMASPSLGGGRQEIPGLSRNSNSLESGGSGLSRTNNGLEPGRMSQSIHGGVSLDRAAEWLESPQIGEKERTEAFGVDLLLRGKRDRRLAVGGSDNVEVVTSSRDRMRNNMPVGRSRGGEAFSSDGFTLDELPLRAAPSMLDSPPRNLHPGNTAAGNRRFPSTSEVVRQETHRYWQQHQHQQQRQLQQQRQRQLQHSPIQQHSPLRHPPTLQPPRQQQPQQQAIRVSELHGFNVFDESSPPPSSPFHPLTSSIGRSASLDRSSLDFAERRGPESGWMWGASRNLQTSDDAVAAAAAAVRHLSYRSNSRSISPLLTRDVFTGVEGEIQRETESRRLTSVAPSVDEWRMEEISTVVSANRRGNVSDFSEFSRGSGGGGVRIGSPPRVNVSGQDTQQPFPLAISPWRAAIPPDWPSREMQ